MTAKEIPKTMKGVVLKGAFDVKVEDVAVPQVKNDTDVLVKVSAAGLCGSDLHPYRGHYPPPNDYVLGHEVVGTVVEVGSAVKKFKVGDKVISAFSASCGDCFYCKKGYTARCANGKLLGSAAVSGAQAEYITIPLGDSTLFHAPEDIPEDLLLMMADILPTGYMTALNAARLASDVPTGLTEAPPKGGVAVVIGCGPVGLCAITSACTLFDKVFATDLQAHRLEAAARHGATALPFDELKEAVLKATDGRGADAVLEVVGHPSAVVSAMQLVRPYGGISSCGVHTHEAKLDGFQLYGKNLRFIFGRCSVPTYFPGAIEILRHNQDLFSTFIEHKVPLSEAEEYYKLFEQNKIGKTVFVIED